MGKLTGGINGKVSGKVGNYVFSAVGDQQQVRARAASPKKFSPAQLLNQFKLKTMQEWITPIGSYVKEGCRNPGKHTGGSALALQYLSANAIMLEDGQFLISPEKMKVSLGNLPGSLAATVVLEEKEAVFTWDTTIGLKCHPYDEVLVLAYNVAQKTACYSLKGHFRRDGQVRLSLSVAGEYHCYLSFLAEDRSRQSNSQYLGIIVV